MKHVAIVGGGPRKYVPTLTNFYDEEMYWIGADYGAKMLLEQKIIPDYSVGDFDSVSESEFRIIQEKSKQCKAYEVEKDETDLELALEHALEQNPTTIYFFGVTGGRLDHALINLQLLYPLQQKGIRGVVIDEGNWVELKEPGVHEVTQDDRFPNVSFVPFTSEVKQLTLDGFYYPLVNANVPWGSTLCISNKLHREKGTFSFEEGILLVIKSRDIIE
ncbi:thiamine pyrophosphokinase [Pontibacillus halophilus JSM 076056 = DSM 19796]|uniref:Thiamine diphosphokinase n=1 Tax=Pontibacillus halophilus JSM 076056 = DSM 19796 TaxID=1385510 RepID=A0A0A5GIX7_9BACI|nr:thiamine diphosphokinase [Pontibacillus halophilus]KGX93211.1 thiamine pyrophosphokinase [Pontibacillus halophilus JSM 076056 = DSM 19796]